MNLSVNFELTAGLRYTKETKDLDATVKSSNRACTFNFAANVQGAAASGLVPPTSVPTIIGLACLPFFNPFHDGVYAGSRKETEWSGTSKLAYTFGEDDLVYASYARGYKGGGYNLDRAGLANPLLGGVPLASDLEFEPELVDAFEFGGKFGAFRPAHDLQCGFVLHGFQGLPTQHLQRHQLCRQQSGEGEISRS